MKDERMTNPVRVITFVMRLLPLPLFIWLGLYTLKDDPLSISISILMFGFFGLFLLIAIHSELINHPREVLLNGNGLTFRFRWSKPKNVPWTDINFISNDSMNGGFLSIKGEFFKYALTRSIVSRIRGAYFLHLGRNALTGEEYNIRMNAIRRMRNHLLHSSGGNTDPNPSWDGKVLRIQGTRLSFPWNVPSNFLFVAFFLILLSSIAMYLTYGSVLFVAPASTLVVFGLLHIYMYMVFANEANKDSSIIQLEREKVVFENSFLDRMKGMPESLRYDEIDHAHFHIVPLSESGGLFLITFIDKDWKAIDGGIKGPSGLREAQNILEAKRVRTNEIR